jgi:hypothetical protein
MSRTLISTDGKSFKLTKNQAAESRFLSEYESSEVKLEFTSAVLEKVQEYLQDYDKLIQVDIPQVLEKSLTEEVGPDNAKFIENIHDWEIVFNLINCALILELPHLHDLACARVANFMKNKSPEDVQKEFTVECQLTADEAKDLGLDTEAQ